MSRIDYSKWDHIEISDDEDDTHPNIDTPSLFRWRHQARVDRMDEQQKEKESFTQEKTSHQQKLAQMKQKVKEAEEKSAADELAKLKLEVTDLEKQELEFKKKEAELIKKEKNTPLNIDTICKDGKSKTLINKAYTTPAAPLTEDEKWDKQQKFTEKNKKIIEKYGMLQKYEDSQEFLKEHIDLVCEETANYLVIWCINLECEEKHDLMRHVAHQTIVMQFILELARTLERDPRACVPAFFSRIKLADQQYMGAFNDELNSFITRVKGRAEARLEAAMKEVEEEERAQRLGPGGLDPVEVFESLPDILKECFESKDIGALQKAVTELPKEQAEYHIKRCVDSGLWVPGGADAEGVPEEETPSEEAAGGDNPAK